MNHGLIDRSDKERGRSCKSRATATPGRTKARSLLPRARPTQGGARSRPPQLREVLVICATGSERGMDTGVTADECVRRTQNVRIDKFALRW